LTTPALGERYPPTWTLRVYSPKTKSAAIASAAAIERPVTSRKGNRLSLSTEPSSVTRTPSSASVLNKVDRMSCSAAACVVRRGGGHVPDIALPAGP
jgi:hypothetical protein